MDWIDLAENRDSCRVPYNGDIFLINRESVSF